MSHKTKNVHPEAIANQAWLRDEFGIERGERPLTYGNQQARHQMEPASDPLFPELPTVDELRPSLSGQPEEQARRRGRHAIEAYGDAISAGVSSALAANPDDDYAHSRRVTFDGPRHRADDLQRQLEQREREASFSAVPMDGPASPTLVPTGLLEGQPATGPIPLQRGGAHDGVVHPSR